MNGIYALVIEVPNSIVIDAGVLRQLKLEKGFYVYVGSAQASIEKRVARHLKKTKRKFWHIDYLLGTEDVSVVTVFQTRAPKSEECKIARLLERVGTAVNKFGSSDCRCRSHLFRVESYEFLRDWLNELGLGRLATCEKKAGVSG